jgi:hypothetical protein
VTAQWYYAIGGRVEGPVTSEDLRQRCSRSEISATDLVWREGMADWASAASLGLATAVAPPPLPSHAFETDSATEVRKNHPADAPSTTHPVTPPPAIEPPRLATMSPAITPTVVKSEMRGREKQSLHRATGPSGARLVLGLAVGVVAILAGGFWIGHVVGSKSSDDTEIQVAAITAPNPTTTLKKRAGNATTGLVEPAAVSTPPADMEMPAGFGRPPINRVARSEGTDPDTAVGLGETTTPELAEPTAADDTPVASTDPPLPGIAAENVTPSPLPTSTGRQEDDGPRVLFQSVEIHRRPTFVMPGITMPQELRYRIVSKLEVARRAADGSRKVVQIIESTHLDHADEMSRAMFAKSLKALQRQQYTFKLNEHNEVIEFTGLKKNAVVLPVKLPTLSGFQLTSVIDEDGWKELAQFTFFQPDSGLAQGQPYVRQMTHDFTPFGAWSGTTSFVGADVRRGLQSFKFQHALKFTPPVEKAAAGPMGFRVVSSRFTIDQADGTLQYDHKNHRVSLARETFHVKGTVAVELAGQSVNIQLTEQQQMTIRITDQRPATN